MTTVQIDLGDRSYPIILTPDLPGPTLEGLLDQGLTSSATRALLVTDLTVDGLYGDGIRRSLEAASLEVSTHVLDPGEASKRLEVVRDVLDAALEAGLGRGDLIVALGGGVVGDIAGFSAAILFRGITYIQVPTTLLAQVDSAVGGKTGVNHGLGKNLIGAFWQPRAVISSAQVLETLPERERRCGLAEALKHGAIADGDLVAFCVEHAQDLRNLEREPVAHLVRRCCEIKGEIVAGDEREAGSRAILNFGHTLGHAYEQVLGYGKLTHGEAVALGMVVACRVSEHLSVATPGLTQRMIQALGALGLPTDPCGPKVSPSELMAAARRDKKARGDRVNFVLLRELGAAEVHALRWQEVEAGGFGTDS